MKKNLFIIVGIILIFLSGFTCFYLGSHFDFQNKQNSNKEENITSNSLIKVPYAKINIPATNNIANNGIDFIEVPASIIGNNVITSINSIINPNIMYCAAEDTNIASNSFFYEGQLKPCDDIYNIYEDLPENYYPFLVKVQDSNPIKSKDKVDIYIKMKLNNNNELNDALVENAVVLSVIDKNNKIIKEGQSSSIKSIIVLMPKDVYELVAKADYLDEVELFAMYKGPYSSTDEMIIKSEYLRSIILSKYQNIPDEVIQ